MKPNYPLILPDRRLITLSLETYHPYSIKVGMASSTSPLTLYIRDVCILSSKQREPPLLLSKLRIITCMGEFITWNIFSQWTLRSYEVFFSTYLEDCSSTACKLPQIRHNPCLYHRTQTPPSSFRAVNKILQEEPLVYHIVFQVALYHWSYSELPNNHTSKQCHYSVVDYSLVLWAQHGILVSP